MRTGARTFLAVAGSLALLGMTAPPATALSTPAPGLVWYVNGDTALLGIDSGPENCGPARSLRVMTNVPDGNGFLWDIHTVTKACHTYEPATRQFVLRNYFFVCEMVVGHNTCYGGTLATKVEVRNPMNAVEFHADGLDDSLITTVCTDAPDLARGEGWTCDNLPDTFTGAPGHRYNAWGFGSVSLFHPATQRSGGGHMFTSNRISKTPDTHVS